MPDSPNCSALPIKPTRKKATKSLTSFCASRWVRRRTWPTVTVTGWWQTKWWTPGGAWVWTRTMSSMEWLAHRGVSRIKVLFDEENFRALKKIRRHFSFYLILLYILNCIHLNGSSIHSFIHCSIDWLIGYRFLLISCFCHGFIFTVDVSYYSFWSYYDPFDRFLFRGLWGKNTKALSDKRVNHEIANKWTKKTYRKKRSKRMRS